MELDDQISGKMSAVAPQKFLGDPTRFNGGELTFDARGRSDYTCFGEIAITGAGQVVRTDVAPGRTVPGTQWTTYRARLTADTFATIPEIWQNTLADVSKVTITLEAYAISNETMGLDNVVLWSQRHGWKSDRR